MYPSVLTKQGRTNEFCSNTCKGERTREIHTGKRNSDEARAKISLAKKGVKNPKKLKPIEQYHHFVCLHCQQPFSLKTLAKTYIPRRQFCSIRCRGDWRTANPEKLWNWRGGGPPPIYGPNWGRQSRLARKRDNFTCRDCGLYQKCPSLDVHHLVPRRTFDGDYEAANRLENLVTLCKTCHVKREMLLTRLAKQREDGNSILLFTAEGADLIRFA